DKQWDKQVLDFLKRTGDEIKSETQKILEDIRAPENQQKIRESLNEFGTWAKQTAEHAAGMLDSALQKAENALNEATDKVLGKPRPKDEPSDTALSPQSADKPTEQAPRRGRAAAGKRSRKKRK